MLQKIFKYGLENIQRVELTGSHVKVTPNCFPRIHRLFVEAAEILEIDHSVIDLYLVGNMSINAYTTGVEKPIIGVHTWTVDMMTEEELQYVIGHELGHIKSRHVLYKTLASVLGTLGRRSGTSPWGWGPWSRRVSRFPSCTGPGWPSSPATGPACWSPRTSRW